MAKPNPGPPPAFTPSAPSSGAKTLSYKALRALWINAGGSPLLASQMAAVAEAEWNGHVPLSDPWHIGYYAQQRGAKAATYKTPLLATRAAVAALNQYGTGYWPTFQAAQDTFYVPTTQAERSQAKATQAQIDANNPALTGAKSAAKAAQAQADLNNAQLQQAKTQAAIQTKQERENAHLYDPWVTVTKDSKGNITGFGAPAYGAAAPNDVLMIAGRPATQSMFSQAWDTTRESTYEAYTGQTPSAAQIAGYVSNGVSVYQLQQQLAAQPGFTSSPIYKANAAGIEGQVKAALGQGAKVPPNFVRDAITQNWDANTVQQNIRQLPGYQKGPQFQNDLAQATSAYQDIYGAAPSGQNLAALRSHVLNGWSPALIQQRLRATPEYKQAFPGLQQGIQNGLTPNEGAYRSYAAQINSLYRQYHNADATPGEIQSLIHQGLTPDVVGRRMSGQAFVTANTPDIQNTMGAFGNGELTQAQLTALGRNQAGLDTALGQKLDLAYKKALQRMHGAFQGVLASPALTLSNGRLQTSSGANTSPDTQAP